MMWRTYVGPYVDYCSILWFPISQPKIQTIERLLQEYTKRAFGMKNKNYWHRLALFRLPSLERRIERYKIIYCHKILEEIVPNPGINEIKNSKTGRMIQIRDTPQGKYAKQIQQSFQLSGPKLYNSIPANLRDMIGQKTEDFKKQLDLYLENIPDQPKTRTLTPNTTNQTNSLTDWAGTLGLKNRRRKIEVEEEEKDRSPDKQLAPA